MTIGMSLEMRNYLYRRYSPSYYENNRLGDSFSSPHIVGYTMILMIEMNIAYRHGDIIWKNSILTINSGVKDDKDSSKNYSKLARALANVSEDVISPSINKSNRKFTISDDEKHILYSLTSINGINADLTQEIIDNRPYSSFKNFLEKSVNMGHVSHIKIINLIKGGAFDEFDKNRVKVMVEYMEYLNPPKNKLTATNVEKMRKLIPKKFDKQVFTIAFDKLIRGKKTYLELDDKQIEDIFMKNYYHLVKNSKYDYRGCGEAVDFDDNGIKIDTKRFSKFAKDYISDLIEWLNTNDGLRTEQKFRMVEEWNKRCKGSVEQWEFEALNVYLGKHILDVMPINDYYTISNYFDMPKEAIIESENVGRNGRVYKNYRQYYIAGTITESDNKKGLVTIVTQHGVVDVRVGKNRIADFIKVVKDGDQVIDDNWLKRGNTVIFKGYRRENEFQVGYNKPSVMKVKSFDSQNIIIKTKKVSG